MLWQVPIGNQVYETEDNTQGHYAGQQGAVHLGHVADFARAGVVMTLFGAGSVEGSHVTDLRERRRDQSCAGLLVPVRPLQQAAERVQRRRRRLLAYHRRAILQERRLSTRLVGWRWSADANDRAGRHGDDDRARRDAFASGNRNADGRSLRA